MSLNTARKGNRNLHRQNKIKELYNKKVVLSRLHHLSYSNNRITGGTFFPDTLYTTQYLILHIIYLSTLNYLVDLSLEIDMYCNSAPSLLEDCKFVLQNNGVLLKFSNILFLIFLFSLLNCQKL